MKDDDVDSRLDGIRRERAEHVEQQTGIGRAVALWERVLRRRRRGDVLLAATGVLIGGVVIAALVVLAVSAATGGGDKPAAAVVAQRTPTEARRATPTATAAPSATVVPAMAPAFRTDCNAIRGTSYQNEAERAYFQQNCLEPGEEPPVVSNPVQPPSRPLGGPTSAPPAVQPTAIPPTPGGSNASRAIGLAVAWLTQSGSKLYTTDAGSCSAVQTGVHWVVTCNARVLGCQGSVCDTTVSVCVPNDLSAVRPSEQC